MSELQTIQDFPFEFYGDWYTAHLANDRQFYVRLADVCNGMGLDVEGQRQRILNDEAIADKLVVMKADTVYKESLRKRDVAFLNMRALPYWLGTIDAKRIKEELREKVIRFKRSFAEAAWQVYRSDIMPAEVLAEMDIYETPANREMLQVMDQARALQKRIESIEGRMVAIEARVSPEAIINTRQQWQVKEMIEAVAEAMFEKKGNTKPRTQCHAETQNDFKNRFQIPIYSLLPERKMEEAVNYLTRRYQHLKPGETLPEVFRDGVQQNLL